jgi:hypothetical protein
MKIFEIIVDYKKTAYKARFYGRATEWYQIGSGGYYEINNREVPIEVKDYIKKIRRILFINL